MVAKQVFFSGQVQGVGFRRFVFDSQQGMELRGFVRNLADGRVELVVQGTNEQIETLLGRIIGRFSDHISGSKEYTIAPEVFDDFSIRS